MRSATANGGFFCSCRSMPMPCPPARPTATACPWLWLSEQNGLGQRMAAVSGSRPSPANTAFNAQRPSRYSARRFSEAMPSPARLSASESTMSGSARSQCASKIGAVQTAPKWACRAGWLSSIDIHRLDVHELVDAVLGQLAPEAGSLGAAERQAHVGAHQGVDEHGAGLDAPR